MKPVMQWIIKKARYLLRQCSGLNIAMVIGAGIAFCAAGFSSFASACEKMPESVFRMHILPNSSSDADMHLKYMLRDYLIAETELVFAACRDLPEAKAAAEAILPEITEKAQAFVRDKGYDYAVTAQIVNMYFNTRTYEHITMPAGNYDALRVVIGNGEGQNWWCVMFPPLCLPACTENREYGESYFSPEVSREIENGGNVEVRFAIYEWFVSLFQ